MDVEVAHSIEGKTPIQKWLAVLVGLSAVVAASLATLDLHSTKRYEDLLTSSSRQSVSLFGTIAASTFPFTAEGIAEQAALFQGVQASSREILSNGDPRVPGFESGLARADRAAADRLSRLAASIGEVPSAESGVDPLARDLRGRPARPRRAAEPPHRRGDPLRESQ
jgi:hypothetical protein